MNKKNIVRRRVWLSPDRFSDCERETSPEDTGAFLLFQISPFQMPMAVTGDLDVSTAKPTLTIIFRYPDNETARLMQVDDKGIEIWEGKHSGNILSIKLDFEDQGEVKGAKERLSMAIARWQESVSDCGRFARELNYCAVKKIVQDEFEKLFPGLA